MCRYLLQERAELRVHAGLQVSASWRVGAAGVCVWLHMRAGLQGTDLQRAQHRSLKAPFAALFVDILV